MREVAYSQCVQLREGQTHRNGAFLQRKSCCLTRSSAIRSTSSPPQNFFHSSNFALPNLTTDNMSAALARYATSHDFTMRMRRASRSRKQPLQVSATFAKGIHRNAGPRVPALERLRIQRRHMRRSFKMTSLTKEWRMIPDRGRAAGEVTHGIAYRGVNAYKKYITERY
jgi:hypothetical protein